MKSNNPITNDPIKNEDQLEEYNEENILNNFSSPTNQNYYENKDIDSNEESDKSNEEQSNKECDICNEIPPELISLRCNHHYCKDCTVNV